jgi:hypothetical protein
MSGKKRARKERRRKVREMRRGAKPALSQAEPEPEKAPA